MCHWTRFPPGQTMTITQALEADRSSLDVESKCDSTMKARHWTASTMTIDQPLRQSCLSSYQKYQLSEQALKQKRMRVAAIMWSSEVASKLLQQAEKPKGEFKLPLLDHPVPPLVQTNDHPPLGQPQPPPARLSSSSQPVTISSGPPTSTSGSAMSSAPSTPPLGQELLPLDQQPHPLDPSGSFLSFMALPKPPLAPPLQLHQPCNYVKKEVF
ncbi:uncharacterized protein LOC113112614 isoform X1 [Carassius auratus]|uniref:Uncharacterized protein LOC113112614 isoform X1 n=1 Tax=Carassius auratus TaxID=7957 RepID=A0A6P6QKN2_CARAU|nr:uncharacterized protein LOC113112614 isoform X1 [Carassius auratus]